MKIFKNHLLQLTLAVITVLAVLFAGGCNSSKVVNTVNEIAGQISGELSDSEAVTSAEDDAQLTSKETESSTQKADEKDQVKVEEDGEYTSKEEVAAYIHKYGKLPSNFITKKEAKALGWDSSENYVGDVAPGKSIGGDKFGNYEGQLPEKEGRQYYECDINYQGKKRGADRIIYSNDGLVYFTEDHYETFELLYGEE